MTFKEFTAMYRDLSDMVGQSASTVTMQTDKTNTNDEATDTMVDQIIEYYKVSSMTRS